MNGGQSAQRRRSATAVLLCFYSAKFTAFASGLGKVHGAGSAYQERMDAIRRIGCRYRNRQLWAHNMTEKREKWQPIETAPKDRRIICYTGRGSKSVMECRWSYDGFRTGWMNGNGFMVDATEWRPLPEPPTEGASASK